MAEAAVDAYVYPVVDAPAPVLWLCGPTGVGKSTVGWEIFVQVARAGVTAAYLDLRQVGFCQPAPVDDPDNHRVKAANLGGMWRLFRDSGARCLVLSGGVDEPDTVGRYAAALPDTVLTLCRLRAGRDQLTERILARGRGEGAALPGDELVGQPEAVLRRIADQAAHDAERLDHQRLGDLWVDTDGVTAEEVAQQVRAAAGRWPDLRP